MSIIFGFCEFVESQRFEEKCRGDFILECFGNVGFWCFWGVFCYVVENSNGIIGFRGRGGVDVCVILDIMVDGNFFEGEVWWW